MGRKSKRVPNCQHDQCRGGQTCRVPYQAPDPFVGLFKSVYAGGQQYQIPVVLDPYPKPGPGCIADIDATAPFQAPGQPHQSLYYGRGVRIEVSRGAFGEVTRVRVYEDHNDQDQAGTKAQFEGPPPFTGGRYAQSGYMRLPDVPVQTAPPSLAGIDPDTVKQQDIPLDIQTFKRLIRDYRAMSNCGGDHVKCVKGGAP